MPGPLFRLPVAEPAARNLAGDDQKPILLSAPGSEEKRLPKFTWVRSGTMWVKAPVDGSRDDRANDQTSEEPPGQQEGATEGNGQQIESPPTHFERGDSLATAGAGDAVDIERSDVQADSAEGDKAAVKAAAEEKAAEEIGENGKAPVRTQAAKKAAALTAAAEKAVEKTAAAEKAVEETAAVKAKGETEAEDKAAVETSAQQQAPHPLTPAEAAQALAAEHRARRAALLPQTGPKPTTATRPQPCTAPDKPAASTSTPTKASVTKKPAKTDVRPPARPPRGPVAPDKPVREAPSREPASHPAAPQTPKRVAAPVTGQTPRRSSPCSAISTTPGSAATRVAPLRPLATCAPQTPKRLEDERRSAAQRQRALTALVGPGLAAQVLTVPEHFTKVKGVALEGVRVDLSTLHIPSEPVVDLTSIILPKTPACGAPWPPAPIDTFAWPEIADHLPETPNPTKMMPMMSPEGLAQVSATLLPPPVFNFGMDLGTDFVMGNAANVMSPVWECPAAPLPSALLDPAVLADEIRGRAAVLGPVGLAGLVAQAPDQVVALLSSMPAISYSE